ncbi:MAG TPA: 4-alpha-glucanotransferase, partial [Dehalococcoidia bacterium]|nr:4-alpha-glucanotransferase [Dehalococcoidia bacterium]
GLLQSDREVQEGRERRATERASFVAWLQQRNLLETGQDDDTAEVLRALLAALAATDAWAVLVGLEDLWLETQPQNTPGTSHERPNWRRKARLDLDTIASAEDVRAALEAVRRGRRREMPR